MKQMVKAKVQQNADVAATLRATGNKRLGETGVHDDYYTIGIKLTHPNVLQHQQWKAGNLMGEVLEKVRQELLS